MKQKPVVAVILFDNLSSWDRADKIIETLFVSAFVKEGYTVVEPANVKKIYITSKVADRSTAVTRIIDPLYAQYGVRYFVTGTVISYGFEKTGEKSIPIVSFNVKMLDRRKKTVWEAYVEKKGTDSSVAFTLGEIRTPDLLAGRKIRKLVSKLCWS